MAHAKKYKPAVLQNECHLYLQQKDLLDFCRIHKIQLQAYSPLGSSEEHPDQNFRLFKPEFRVIEHPVVKRIAEKFQKSPAQIALRYAVQRGISVVAKSTSVARIQENLQLFDFSLTRDDMDELGTLNCHWRSLRWPQTAGHPNYPFKDDMVGPTVAAKAERCRGL